MLKLQHCSYEGSWLIDFEMIEENVPFDVEKHGTFMDKLFPLSCINKFGKIGHVIKYLDLITEEEVIEWQSLEYFYEVREKLEE